uniref:uncharacterized protein LOC131127691 n=1 Tax=Doryrhamphus excisus TaxID=161450 RepID=UPI0025AE8200|nr:uncharacterized protein LOC131127691 [Doryrhamphus excisus]
MFRPQEREPRGVDRPQRVRQPPSHLQDYEVSYPMRCHVPGDDERATQMSSPEIIRSIQSMREENDQLRRDVQRLSDMIHSLPATSSRSQTQSRRQMEEIFTTLALASKPTPSSGHQGPRQPLINPPVNNDALSPPQGNQSDIVEDLRQCLEEAGLANKHTESQVTSGISTPCSQDKFEMSYTKECQEPRHHDDQDSSPPSKAHHQSNYGQQPWPKVAPRQSYVKHHSSYEEGDNHYHRPYHPPRHPSYPYYSDEGRHPATSRLQSSPRARHESRYYGHESGYPLEYRGHLDDYNSAVYGHDNRQREERYPPDPPYPSTTPYGRMPALDSYRGPKPTIPDFKSEDPREFARLKLALDNLLPYDAPERFKFQILMDHLKCEEALLIADSYSNSPRPFADTMRALTEMYGQPQQLALKRISMLMDGPNVRTGDIKAFKSFALQVRALVGMLHQLGSQGWMELRCGSHVSRLLAKLPHDLRANFHRYVNPIHNPIPTLINLADWLEYEVRVQVSGDQHSSTSARERQVSYKTRPPDYKSQRTTAILHGSESTDLQENSDRAPAVPVRDATPDKPKKYCPFCDTAQHYLNQCSNFKLLSVEQRMHWIKANNRCWRCGREHLAAKCNLKAKCKRCERKHLEVLHEVNSSQHASAPSKPKVPESSTCLVSSVSETLFIDRPASSSQVLLKLSRVILQSGSKVLETYAILDDGSERTILLNDAAVRLGLGGKAEDLTLRTVRQEICTIHGATVSFSVAAASQPDKCYKINKAFTSRELNLASYTYPVKALQEKYRHLRDIPLPPIKDAQPLLLIGSDYPHLITPVEPVCLGPPGGPAAVHTRLGWTLQGPTSLLNHQLSPQQCLFTACNAPEEELFRHVEKLWQLDTLPYRSERLITRSKQDAEAVRTLELKTTRVMVDGVNRYATPLLWKQSLPLLQATKEAVLSQLRGAERRLVRDPKRAAIYSKEIHKLIDAGYVKAISPCKTKETNYSWFIPHHMVQHNGKYRIVFNCSFTFNGQSLNDHLLPGPTLGASLLGVLLRFREHPVAISSDVKGMFHQVRLLEEDKPFLRFLWRDVKVDQEPTTYEWQVLPFGTTCSPCCATFALQTHVHRHTEPKENARLSAERCFYVDNCLQSLQSEDQAKQLVSRLHTLLMEGGFELREWASNVPAVIRHLPKESQSESSTLWFAQQTADPQERTLGLLWQCRTDTLGYKQHQSECPEPTMRNIYRLLAQQYDPLGYIVPYITRAKIIVQRLWDRKRGWDDPNLPEDLLQAWRAWEYELPQLAQVILPRCYTDRFTDCSISNRTIHVFCDASERAYGSVAYLLTDCGEGQVQVAFLAARSRVAPKKQLSIPRLELCGALTGAQLASVLIKELTIKIQAVVYWTDSTTVLHWLQSDSCRYKVFVGTRVAEIQDLTDINAWRYVDSATNPADDITRGKTLTQLSGVSRWSHGPPFLLQPSDQWPESPPSPVLEEAEELRNAMFCGLTVSSTNSEIPDIIQFRTFQELLEATTQKLHGAADNTRPTAADYHEAELALLRYTQIKSFPEEVSLLKMGKPLSSNSRLLTLAPEYDQSSGLIRVGGRLRRCDSLSQEELHPILLPSSHPVVKLLIQHYDNQLHHPGSERVFAELRRKYWILRGREAVKKHQHYYVDCRKWRSRPQVPRMADIPPSSLRLCRPAFYSTGVDCFGPMIIKVGRRTEKRRFVARRGKPYELLSDQGTNFKGGNKELHEAFSALEPAIKDRLAAEQIRFKFNPPNAPHFGGSWEREVRSVKNALRTTLGAQTVPEEVLMTVLIEIEGILNSRPLGYVSSDLADPDPVTPNCLLMGRPDSSLPQVIYPATELLSRKRWRHSQILADHFWKHYIQHFLPTLQARQKWKTESDDITVGTVVLIVDQQAPRALWQIGTVKTVIPGADGRVRTAVIRVKDRTYTRPVVRLVKLPALPRDIDDT